jgi:hypothetical protein
LEIAKQKTAPGLDIIDLNGGRDFLKEERKYDIVCLHYIFALDIRTLSQSEKHTALILGVQQYTVSDIHTPENWRKRLISTEAKSIIVYGQIECDSEVNYKYLGEIDGYDHSIVHQDASLYTKRP